MKKMCCYTKRLFLLITVTVTFTGCGIWADFTTYFNLYYNTKDKFEEAETSIKQQRKNLFEIGDQNVSSSAPQSLNTVVEKASKILQFHNNSSYVDNALLMLGKSFYYQKNYQKAIRKFQELIVTDPESDLILENDLWIAKTQMKLKDYKNALALLKTVREQAIEEDEDEILTEAYVEEIVYHIIQENYPVAIAVTNEFLEFSDNDEVNAEVTYELGRLYQKTKDLPNAVESFKKVFDYSPTFDIELKAMTELAIVLRESGESEDALVILEEMRSKNKYFEAFDKIDLETGLTLFSLGRVDEAVELLVLVDTTYVTSSNSGIAKYKLGQIFETHYMNFDSASSYYVKAASSTAPPEYSKPASDKAQLFRKYQTMHKTIADSRKQLSYLEDPEAFINDSIAFYSDTLSNEEEQTTQQISQNEKGTEGDEKGFVPPTTTQTPPKTQTKNPPVRPNISADSLNSIIVKNEFDLANLFFTELNVQDSAYYYYKNIADNHPSSAFFSRSLYSIGTYYNSVGKQFEADSIFNYIYDNFKTESIVNAAANQLKKPIINLNYDPSDELYLEAETTLEEKNFNTSIDKFYDIFIKYPRSPNAPKALYAGGWILENELKLFDSAAVFYDSINVIYPQSQYASAIRPKLTFFKEELERKRRAVEDSLKQIELNKKEEFEADSLNKSMVPGIEINEKEVKEEDKSDSDEEEKSQMNIQGNDAINPDKLPELKEPENQKIK